MSSQNSNAASRLCEAHGVLVHEGGRCPDCDAHFAFYYETPRGWRCKLFRHPWRWSSSELFLRLGLSFKVCTKEGCRDAVSW